MSNQSNSYLTDEEYDFIYSRSPRICVDLLIKNSAGYILLTKRSIEPYKDHWHFPGGRIKFRETIDQAIKRVLKSELGQHIDVSYKQVGICEFLEEEQKGQLRHSISIVHEIWLPDDVSIMLDGNAAEAQFFSQLPSPIIPSQYEFLNSYK